MVLDRVSDPALRWVTNPPSFPEFSPVVAVVIVLLGVPAAFPQQRGDEDVP